MEDPHTRYSKRLVSNLELALLLTLVYVFMFHFRRPPLQSVCSPFYTVCVRVCILIIALFKFL